MKDMLNSLVSALSGLLGFWFFVCWVSLACLLFSLSLSLSLDYSPTMPWQFF